MRSAQPRRAEMTDYNELLAEQLLHTIDNLKADMQKIKLETNHECALLEHRIVKLDDCRKDHEIRLRELQDGVTSFKVWSGLSSGGAGVVSIFALLRTLIGG